VRALYLSNLAGLQLTNFDSLKERPSLASSKLIWQDHRGGTHQVMIGVLPNLQPVFNNQNAVAISDGMATFQGDAYTLMALWNREAGVTRLTRYTQLVPIPAEDTALWDKGQPSGSNFALTPGDFLWVKFDQSRILDLGPGGCSPVDLSVGVNVFSFWCFPDGYTAFRLIHDLGMGQVNGLRMLNSDTGKWQVAAVDSSTVVGEDFPIPKTAVIMLDMAVPVSSWLPRAD
jgi:hypothetical protein